MDAATRTAISVGGAILLAAALLALLLTHRPRATSAPGVSAATRAFGFVLVAILFLHAAFVAAVTWLPGFAQDLYTVGLAWPLRIFAPRLGILRWPDVVGCLAGAIALVVAVRRAVSERPMSSGALWALSLAILLALNASQGGPWEGLVAPLTDPQHHGGIYDDAERQARDPISLSEMDEPAVARSWESPHTKSHPFLLVTAFGSMRRAGLGLLPLAIVLIAIASLVPVFAAALFRRVRGASDLLAGRMALLLVLVPAVDVYGATSLEGPLLSICLASLAAFAVGTERRQLGWIAAAGLLLALAACWSFGAIWLVGVFPFLGISVERKYLHKVGRRAAEAGVLAAPLLLLHLILRSQGYDYARHFASVASSGMGVPWLATTWVLVHSRLQNIAEIVLLGTPLLVGGWLHAWARLRRVGFRGLVPSLAAPGVPLAVLLLFTPIYSEFARGWNFVYPVLLLPLAPFVRRSSSAAIWLGATAAWTWGWQVFGYHAW